MSSNPIQFLRVDHGESKRESVLELESNTRSVLFGRGTRARVLLLDESEEVDLAKHEGDVIGSMKLARRKRGHQAFLTIGEDHSMMIWSHQGRHLAVLAGHTRPIRAVWELSDHRLVSWSDDGSARVWNTRTGTELARIPTSIASADDLFIMASGEMMCLIESGGTRILAIDGTERATLRKQTEPLRSCLSLVSGRWATCSKNTYRLWSKSGNLLQELDHGFSFDDGFFELKDGRLVISDQADQVLLFGANGKLLAKRESESEIATSLRRFFSSCETATRLMRERPSYEYFNHFNSPISGSSCAHDELARLEASEETLARNRFIWDFFNRPDFRAIRTALRAQVDTAQDTDREVSAAVETHRELASKAKKLRSVWGVLLPVAVIAGAIAAAAEAMGLAVLAVLFALYAARTCWRQHIACRANTAGARALEPVRAEIPSFIARVKQYRRGILSQVPIVRSGATYTGKEVQASIQKTIEEKLEPMALRECGLRKDDVLLSENESILLREWALIQSDHDALDGKLSEHDIKSFWSAADGEILFAVQYIQFIFLTNDKLDVFTAYYDFVTDRVAGKEAHAFYYKDVTNISKRDVDRPAALADTTFEATEIMMAVSSGQVIRLTVLNDESVSSLRRKAESEESISKEDRIVEIQMQLDRAREDQSLSEEDRTEEIEALEGQLASVRAESVGEVTSEVVRSADEAIKNIRGRIREHKQAESRTESSSD